MPGLEHGPFGSVFALRTGDQRQLLRFPGHEAEQLNLGSNGLTEREYNIFKGRRVSPRGTLRAGAASAALVLDDYPSPEVWLYSWGRPGSFRRCIETLEGCPPRTAGRWRS